jgi:hypothetical protein
MPEYHGIWRNITEYAGISRNMAEYHGIYRNITIFSVGSYATVYKHGRLTTYFITKVMDLSIPILTVSNKQKLYTGSFICCLYHYYEGSQKMLNQYN